VRSGPLGGEAGGIEQVSCGRQDQHLTRRRQTPHASGLRGGPLSTQTWRQGFLVSDLDDLWR
jgi:hypothetical protein